MFAPTHTDTKPPESVVQAIRHIDHVTYAVKLENEKKFIDLWATLGFHEHVRLRCRRWPATHIALVSGSSPEFPWATMTGLSVSEKENSPINHFISRYGEGVQHTAYNIDPNADMKEIYTQMKELGWNFMTPVLTYKDQAGARLKQMFIAPSAPFGTFIEFVQRLEGENGAAFDGFDIRNIDGLYQAYYDYSIAMEK